MSTKGVSKRKLNVQYLKYEPIRIAGFYLLFYLRFSLFFFHIPFFFLIISNGILLLINMFFTPGHKLDFPCHNPDFPCHKQKDSPGNSVKNP